MTMDAMTKTPTNVQWRSNYKTPKVWEVWHSYDGGKTWTMVGTKKKTKENRRGV